VRVVGILTEIKFEYLSPLRILTSVGRRAEALRARRARAKRYATAKALLGRASFPLKVNVGCGYEPFVDWINLDLDSGTRADLFWDVTDGLPFPDDSCAFIYSEHFLEHIPVQMGVRFLTECRRSLQSGGVVRIGMPCAQELIRHYYDKVWAKQTWLHKYGYSGISTRAEYINVCFRDWGHQWLYDFEELNRRLREAGFSGIESVAWGESKYQELRKRETREETALICEATK
jgi:predicted SAM-dependent methyltransferase